jgi:hypothetical protein
VQRTINNEREPNNEQPEQATNPVLAVSIPVAVSIDPGMEVAAPVVWTGRLRTAHVAIFPPNASKISNTADSIAQVQVLAAIASALADSAAGEDSAGSGAEDFVAAPADSGAAGNI